MLHEEERAGFPVARDETPAAERSNVEGLSADRHAAARLQRADVDSGNVAAERARDETRILVGRERKPGDEQPRSGRCVLKARASHRAPPNSIDHDERVVVGGPQILPARYELDVRIAEGSRQSDPALDASAP